MIRKAVRFGRSLWACDEGATIFEYAVLISFLAIACVAAVSAMSAGVQALFNSVPNPL